MTKKRFLAAALCLSMTASALAGSGLAVSAEEEKEPVELTLWVTGRQEDDWRLSYEEAFLAEHPWITLNKIVKEGDPGNEFYQGVAAGNAPDLVNCSFTMMDSYMTSGIRLCDTGRRVDRVVLPVLRMAGRRRSGEGK